MLDRCGVEEAEPKGKALNLTQPLNFQPIDVSLPVFYCYLLFWCVFVCLSDQQLNL